MYTKASIKQHTSIIVKTKCLIQHVQISFLDHINHTSFLWIITQLTNITFMLHVPFNTMFTSLCFGLFGLRWSKVELGGY